VAGATGVLLNVTGGPDLGLFEIDEAAGIIRQAAHDDCNVIFGAVIDENAGDTLRVTVIATGFEGTASADAAEPRFGRRERAGAVTPRRREKEENGRPAPTIALEAQDRKSLEVPDDALEIPDFLKGS
jgi:cell division protein FtsZ